jgi:tetratricopeptide (TPR) repeat protein
MNREPGTPDLLCVPAEQVELALARIEHSAAFRGSPRHRALLRHLVARALADDHASLKETLIAIEVFGRPAASFDPKLDTIVRVEARRLRSRLSSYYRGDGRDTPIRIELPVGSYVPLIAGRAPALHAADATRRARDLVERGEHFLRQALSRETLEQARQRFDQALRESPEHAPASVGLGRAWLNLATGWHVEPAIASAHAAEALRRALELDPHHAVGHALLGAIQHQFEHDWAGALRHFKRALALAPQAAFVHSAYGCHLYLHGALAQAEQELVLARELDPQYINTRNHMVNLRIRQGRLDDAEAEVQAMQDIAPETISVVGLRAAIMMFRGDALAAATLYGRLCEVCPDHPGVFIALASAQALAGSHGEADALVADTLRRFAGRPVSPYLLAIFATRRGCADEAFAQLERACVERDPSALQIPLDPSFGDLHGDARWGSLLARAPFGSVRPVSGGARR